jgi:hypothetical protein
VVKIGYLHIDNLYKNIEILNFKEVYALEKVHGTSAHISWKPEQDKVIFFSGGAEHSNFIKLFDEEALKEKFKKLFNVDTTVFGEAYGGKCQGMSHTYGKELDFIVFDVKVGDTWLNVLNAEDVANKLNLMFVPYERITTDLEAIDRERDRDSLVGAMKGNRGKMREGVVLRPLEEYKKSNGSRVIVKHKRNEFMETKTKREVDPAKLKVLEEAKEVADEWVTPMRLEHVLDKLDKPLEMESTRFVIPAMIEDVKREGEGEIVWSKEVEKAIGKEAARLYKQKVTKI